MFYIFSFMFLVFVVEGVTEIIEHPYNQCYELCVWYISCLYFVGFLFSGVFACSFIWDMLFLFLYLTHRNQHRLPLCLLLCVRQSCYVFTLGRVAKYSRCSVGPRGALS